MRFFAGIAFLFVVACSTSATKDTPSGDGHQYTVVCRNEMQDCFERCQSLCPHGYLVKNRVRGAKIGENTEYTVMIRCKRENKRGTL